MYENPIVRGCFPDPSACRVGNDYYLASSSFEYFPGVPILHSRDLRHWRALGHGLTRKSQLSLDRIASSQGIYAPTLRYHAGTFYLITTIMPEGRSFFVTAKDPSGPWSEPIYVVEDSWSMDPSLFFDDDGKVYYTRHGGKRFGAIFQAELDVATGQLREPAREIWRGTGGIWPEGPHLYRIAGSYYLLISEGGTGYEHCLTVARSRTPWGPFEPCPENPILTHRDRSGHPIQATGHGDLVQTPEGEWWLLLLGIRPTDSHHHHLGRETFLAPVRFDEAGWPVVNSRRSLELRMDAAGLPVAAPPASPTAIRDDFDGGALDLEWRFVRNPDAESWSLAARPGFLRLLGRSISLSDVASPAFVSRRQQHFRCRVECALELERGAGAATVEAGLALRANDANHYELVISDDGGKRRVRLRQTIAEVRTLTGEALIGPGRVHLVIEAHPERYDFWFANAEAEPLLLGSLPTVPLSSEVVESFTGVHVGLYATSGDSATTALADFDWFEYQALEA